MASRREDRAWRLIAVLQSTAALSPAVALKLYETAVALHVERRESEPVAGDEGVGTVRALGRELLGGNGVVADFLVAKAFGDMEAIYTYEGTYEVNALVAGRGATGLAAFKPPPGRK